jgi:long-chain fatty acid transport protein
MKHVALLLICITGVASSGFAQGFQVNFQGQKQQGMGSAGSALIQDASTVFFNPAGISFLSKIEVNLAMTPVFSSVLFEETDGEGIGRTNSPVGTPFSGYATYKKDSLSPLGIGFGVYTPFGSTISWEDGWSGRYTMLRLQLRAIYFQPTVSYRISKNVSLGAGFVFASGGVSLKKNIPVSDSSYSDGLAELTGKAKGLGYNIGVHWQANEKFSLGFNYRSQINVEVKEGIADFTVPVSLEANFPDGTFSSSLPLPQVATIGLSYAINDQWKFALDVNWIGWKAYDTLGFDYAQNTTSLLDTRSARMYKNSCAFRGGTQYRINSFFTVRAGLAYGISPVQDGYLTPETPDANRMNYTAGCSFLFGQHFSLDLSLLYTHVNRRDTNLETALSGTFRANAFAPGFSLIYTFGK